MQKTKAILIVEPIFIGGEPVEPSDDPVDIEQGLANRLIASNKAVAYVEPEKPAKKQQSEKKPD